MRIGDAGSKIGAAEVEVDIAHDGLQGSVRRRRRKRLRRQGSAVQWPEPLMRGSVSNWW